MSNRCVEFLVEKVGYHPKKAKKIYSVLRKRIGSDIDENTWIDKEDIRSICSDCAEKMENNGIERIKLSSLRKKVAYGWDNLPKGWNSDSVRKFWNTLTGDKKQKVTACHKKMRDEFGSSGAWAFCSSLNDMIEGDNDWRKAKKKQLNPLRNTRDYGEGATGGMQESIERLENKVEKEKGKKKADKRGAKKKHEREYGDGAYGGTQQLIERLEDKLEEKENKKDIDQNERYTNNTLVIAKRLLIIASKLLKK